MCYRPIRIKNLSRSFSEHYSPLYFYVPCGKCESCLKNISDEYFIRSYFEWLSVSVNGSTFFITLTYRDEDLPNVDGVQYFEKEHVQNFIKKLRIYLKRAGYSDNFRYFVVSEYGGITKRVHFHCLLFFPYKIDSYQLINYIPHELPLEEQKKLYGFVQRAWIYGHSSYSKKGAEILSAAALRYCCKYLCKFNDVKEQDRYNDVIDKKRRPFHLQSKGYGLSMLEHLSNEDKLKCRVRLVTSDKKETTFTLPTLIQRYLYYSYDKETNLYRINQLGIYVKTEHLQKKIDSIAEEVSNFFDVQKLRYFIGPLENNLLQRLQVDSIDSLVDELCKIPVSDRKYISEFLAYPRFVVNTKNTHSIPNIWILFMNYMNHCANGYIFSESPLNDINYFNKLKHYTYEFHKIFTSFSYFVQVYETSRYLLDNALNAEKLRKRKRDEEISNYFNNIDYV